VTLAACTNQPGLSPSDAGLVHWIGLDSRPLAVGSQLIVTLEIATDAGAEPPYTVTSSDPAVVAIADAGNERLLLSALAEGSATLELQTRNAKADLVLTAAIPVALEFFDAERYAAGIGTPLDQARGFEILVNSEERLQGVVLDAAAEPLNSWGLIFGRPANLTVSKQEPEAFIVAQEQLGSPGTFVAGLIDAGISAPDGGVAEEDGGSHLDAGSTASFTVNIVSSATYVALVSEVPAGSLVVVAEALASDHLTQVFGIDDWEFSCSPPATCMVTPLSSSVAEIDIPAQSGPHTVTVSSSSQALDAGLVIP